MNDRKPANPLLGAAHASALVYEKQLQMQQEKIKKALEEEQERVQKSLIEASAKAIEKAQAYTNVIIIAGYAGGFSIWSSTKAQLPNKANVVIALSLGVSLFVFIFHEIYGMITRSIYFNKIRPIINMGLQPEEFMKEFGKLKKEEEKQSINATPLWHASLVCTIFPALMAICILFYNYFAILVGWPLWPT